MYSPGKNKPFYYTLILLKLFLWYPLKSDRLYMRIFFSFSCLLRLMSFLTALGTLAHLVIVIRDKVDVDISEDIGDLSGFIGCMVVCLSFLTQHSRWCNFFKRLLNFKHFGTPPTYQAVVQKGNLGTLVCIVYTIPGMFWYCYLTYKDIPLCEVQNRRLGRKEPCGMVNPTWMPHSQMEGTPFFVWYLLQSFGIFIYLPSSFAICSIPMEAVGIIISRIDHLRAKFKDLLKLRDRSIYKKQIQYCVSYHQDIIEVSKELSALVKSTMGSLLLTAAVVIGSLGSQVIKASTPKAISFIMGYVAAMFLVCHAGQRLIDESLNLTDEVYNTQWYRVDPSFRKDFTFILARCQKPLSMPGPASIGAANYGLFLIVIKTSYSYLTLLNEMI
ncbi:putative odorant receptor 85d [Euwallacea similis]|uniref:putative odorant receptor 85d n=1 Tax=Euwallacea similis TaxID=1736056 RepID=UPI00344F6FB4